MQLISFSGVDGSGKSSQLTLLKNHLESSGAQVAYFHAVEFSLANRLNRSFKGKKQSFIPGQEKAVLKASQLSLFLREIFLCIDILRFNKYRKNLEKTGVEYLLSDRFFYDSLINIAYLKNAKNASSWVKNLIPRSDIAFYFNLSGEAIMGRERAPEQGIQYLNQKISLFQQELSHWNMISIDADRSKEEIFQDILKEIKASHIN